MLALARSHASHARTLAMGIQGLLPLLKDIQAPIHVSALRGQTLGIDGYVWLHRGAYGCAEDLVHGRPTTKYVNYALHRIRMLRHHGISPYVVFDGDRLPSKQRTEDDREARRRECLEKAQRARASTAFELYAKCVDVTPEMAYQLIKALKAEGVAFVVAPYEADAQLAYLERTGLIDAVVTEDSDLLVFGCKRVLFKMDSNGDCIEVSRNRFTACRTVSLAGWTSDLFRQMAILSGCDYLPSITGMGLKNAHRLLHRYKTVKKVLQAIRLEGKLRIPPDYIAQFEQAEKTFIYQRVYDPRAQTLTTLNPIDIDDAGDDADADAVMTYIGPMMSDAEARGIACGDIDPISRKPMQDVVPSYRPRGGGGGSGGGATTSKAIARATPPSAATPLDRYFAKGGAAFKTNSTTAATAMTPRRPLASKDTNVQHQQQHAGTPPVRSIFFGGNAKGVGGGGGEKASTGAMPVCTDTTSTAAPSPQVYESTGTTPARSNPTSTAALTPLATGSTSNLPERTPRTPSAMGDYYFELDGGDPDDLATQEDDDVERIPAFAEYANQDDDDDDGDSVVRPHCASFTATPHSQRMWSRRCDGESGSDVSSEASIDGSPPRKREARRGSSVVSEDVHATPGDFVSSPVGSAASDLLTSPQEHDDGGDDDGGGGTVRVKNIRSASPTSPLATKRKREHCGDEDEDEDDIGQHSDNDGAARATSARQSVARTPSAAIATTATTAMTAMTATTPSLGLSSSTSADLWTRFSHNSTAAATSAAAAITPSTRRPLTTSGSASSKATLATPSTRRPLTTHRSASSTLATTSSSTSSLPFALQRTPSMTRPLRLYESPASPCQSAPFQGGANGNAKGEQQQQRVAPRPMLDLSRGSAAAAAAATTATTAQHQPQRPKPRTSLSMSCVNGGGGGGCNDDKENSGSSNGAAGAGGESMFAPLGLRRSATSAAAATPLAKRPSSRGSAAASANKRAKTATATGGGGGAGLNTLRSGESIGGGGASLLDQFRYKRG